ncbi:MAG: SpoIIIAH-like family protein [Clostridia bacterium]|nr:SpoIIIAH-like family protein [Clostridia bacterium]
MIAGKRGLLAARGMLAFAALAFLAAASLPFWAKWPGRVMPSPALTPEAAAAEYCTDRNALRKAELNELRLIALSPDTSDELRAAAQERIMALLSWMDQEATVEAVLAARGFPPALVTVRADSVNAVVSAPLAQNEAAALLDLIMRETGIDGGNIKIIMGN